MNCRKTMAGALDAAVLGIFRRARYHQELGDRYMAYANGMLPKAFGNCYRAFLEGQLKNYKNLAYLQVQGQTLLIDMDIIGVDIEANGQKTNQAAFATGLLWYSIKLLDNIIDENNLKGNELADFLHAAQESWASGKTMHGTSEKEHVINATACVLNSGYAGRPDGYMRALTELCDAELGYIYSKRGQKVEHAKAVGKTSAELTIRLVEQYMPGYPYGCEEFLIEQGITGKLFDDFKDRRIDREQGGGYEESEIRGLAAQGLRHFYRHFKALPSFRARWRNFNFIVLASLFHAKELLRTKEKS
ncbi:MAG TPA: hypothetical protein HA362_07700 [Nanoarchaeota archaeon]|nr:hypothetical protein [Nanoarchaeota archaeon]